MKRVLFAVVVFALCHSTAQAQTCLGAMSFEMAPMRAGAEVTFSSETQTIDGGVSLGNAKYFYGLGGVFETASGFDDSAKGFFVNAGTERALGAEKKFFFCPIVSIFKTWGLSPFVDGSNSSLLFSVVGTVGYTAVTNGTTRIVPFGGLAIDYVHEVASGGGFFQGDSTFSDTFASLQFGVGLVLNEKMVLTPVVAIPIGSANDFGPRFSAAFTTKIGK